MGEYMNKKLLLINGYNDSLKLKENRLQFFKDLQSISDENLNLGILERFFNRINFKCIENNECWVWTGPCQPIKNGNYGRISINHEEYKTHRLMYYLIYGSFDPSFWILHYCDNPPCCNPNHLKLGTPDDNSKDMVSKKRQAKGSDIPQSKLNETIIYNILDNILNGKITSIKQIMATFNISRAAAYHIFDKKHWRVSVDEYCESRNVTFNQIRNKIVTRTNSYLTHV